MAFGFRGFGRIRLRPPAPTAPVVATAPAPTAPALDLSGANLSGAFGPSAISAAVDKVGDDSITATNIGLGLGPSGLPFVDDSAGSQFGDTGISATLGDPSGAKSKGFAPLDLDATQKAIDANIAASQPSVGGFVDNLVSQFKDLTKEVDEGTIPGNVGGDGVTGDTGSGRPKLTDKGIDTTGPENLDDEAEAPDETEQAKAQREARNAERRRLRSSRGRRSTLVTGPQGLLSAATTARPTLSGS